MQDETTVGQSGGARIRTGDASDSLTASAAEQRGSHTPGPWQFLDDDIQAECGTHVVCFGHDYDDYGGIHARATVDDAVYQAEREANARLLAAAPDLLAALKNAHNYLDSVLSPCESDCKCIIHEVESAIAKAEGR